MENKFKRFLSLLLALVMVIGLMPMGHVHAEGDTVTALGEMVTEVAADTTYVIALHGTKNALTNEQGAGDWGTHTLATASCGGNVDSKFLWTLEVAEGGYKLKNADRYLFVERNTANLNDSGHVFELAYTDAGWTVKSLASNEYFNNLGDSGSIGGWREGGTTFDIYTVTEKSWDEIDPWGKRNWIEVSVDTETIHDAKEGQFEYAWDNNPASHWHSNWQGASDKLTGENTFTGIIDFGQAYLINKFSFTPRTDKDDGTGIVTQASLYVKENEADEWIAVAENMTFASDYTKKDIDFEAQNVRYVKFVAEQASDGWVTVSEFEIDYIAPVEPELSRVEQMVKDMSLRDKVTQMLMVDFRKWGATNASATDFTVMNDEVRKIVEDYNFGSVIYFANNIKTTEDTFALTQEMQAAATKDGGIALIICADQEGGSVYRLGSGTALPGNMALGATYAENGTKYAYWAGKIIGSELGILGINGNLAPVVDVNNNANNPVIGLRSYGDDAVMVGELASAAIAGMAEYNVIGTAKHFPGHGDTATDSHYGLPSVDKSLDVLMETELAPYTVAIEQGIEMIMTAHILYPQLESDKILSNKTGKEESLPATMSDDILTGLLKGEMGFEGIVVTDAMNMAGISDNWDQVQSCVIAIQSGVDLICMPCQLYCQADLANLDAIIDGLIDAVEDGTIPMERVNDAVTRILTVKENRGILDYNAEDYTLENAQAVVGSDENREMERELAAAAVTVIKNKDDVLPLNLTSESKVLMMVPYNNERAQMLMGWNRAKEVGLIPAGAQVDYVTFSKTSTIESLKEKMDWADTLIINSEISATSRYNPTGSTYWLYNVPNQICDYAAANGKIAVISSVDKPYDVQMYANANAIVAAYGCKGSSVDPTEALIGGATGSAAAYGPNIIAAVEVILGTYGAQGKLPVNIPVLDMDTRTFTDEIAYARGYGLTYEAKVGHEHECEATVTAPTCVADGYTTYKCTICDYSYVADVTPATGEHTPAEAVRENEVPATCDDDGSYDSVVYCSVCGAEISRETVTVDATGHTPAEAVRENEVPATCGDAGSYDSVVYCSVCGAEISRETVTVEATGEHTYDDDADVDCNVCGAEREFIDPNDPWGKGKWVRVEVDSETIYNEREGEFEFSWDGDLNTIWHTNWQGAHDVLTGENTFSGSIDFTKEYFINQFSFTPRQDDTQWENGSGVVLQASLYVKDADDTEWKCVGEHVVFEHNQQKKTFYFPEQNVQYVKFVAEKASQMGMSDNNGPVGYVAVAEFDIDYVVCEHTNKVTRDAVEVTCLEDGYTGDTYCALCNTLISEGEVITAAGSHTEAEAVRENEVPATCTTEGSYDSVVYCSVCEEELSRESFTIEMLEHDFVEVEAVEPTCTETGLTAGVKCSVCGEIESGCEEIEALGHDFVNGDCSRCDAEMDPPFEDVPVGEFYFDPVYWAVENGITTGATETLYNPSGDLLRAQFVTFLWRAAGSPKAENAENPFIDVKEGDFFYDAVLWAVENEITNGISENEFGAYNVTNRAQAVTFLWRYKGEPTSTATSDFSDVVAGEWYASAINWAVENKVTNGMGDGTFGIGGICNRAQAVTFLYRATAE